jgi:predicted nucleotidyltransferase
MDRKTIPPHIRADIRRLIQELDAENINVERAFLFGSQASGGATEWSDIDVALVSPDFTGNRFDDNCRIRKAKLRVNRRFDTHPFTREDFSDSPFVRDEILKHGIEVK